MAAAALVGAASAGHHGHAHDLFHLAKRNESAVCVPTCTTIYTTITGDFICTSLHVVASRWRDLTANPSIGQPTPDAQPAVNSTSTSTTSTTSTLSLTKTTAKAVVPTPAAQTCETPGLWPYCTSALSGL